MGEYGPYIANVITLVIAVAAVSRIWGRVRHLAETQLPTQLTEITNRLAILDARQNSNHDTIKTQISARESELREVLARLTTQLEMMGSGAAKVENRLAYLATRQDVEQLRVLIAQHEAADEAKHAAEQSRIESVARQMHDLSGEFQWLLGRLEIERQARGPRASGG